MKHKCLSFLSLIIFLCTSFLMAGEMVMIIDSTTKTKVLEDKENKPVSIDALLVKYHKASAEEAKEIMRQIKQYIAHMAQERQANAIDKAQKELDQ